LFSFSASWHAYTFHAKVITEVNQNTGAIYQIHKVSLQVSFPTEGFYAEGGSAQTVSKISTDLSQSEK